MKTARIYCALFVLLSFVCLPVLAGGSGFGVEEGFEGQKKKKRNPFTGIKKVAVIPFFNMGKDIDTTEFGNAFTGVMENIPGWEMVYPQIVEQQMKANSLPMNSVFDALRIGRLLKVDAVLVGEIREFDAYYPPRIVLKVSLYKTLMRDRSEDIIRLSRAGVGDFEQPIKPDQAIWSLSSKLDSRNKKVANQINKYAKLQNTDNSGFGIEQYYRVKTLFFEAISFIVSQGIIREMKKPDGSKSTPINLTDGTATWTTPNPRDRRKKAKR